MDPSEQLFYKDGRRLTPERVAGFALEVAFQRVHNGGLFDLTNDMVSTVTVRDVAPRHAGARKCTVVCSVTAVHQQAILKAVEDISQRLHHRDYAIVGAIVPQVSHSAEHDLVLENRRTDACCNGKYSAELKLRTAPSNRVLMRRDCASLFQCAIRNSTAWLGQLIVVAEITSTGAFLCSRAELLMRDRPRDEALNLWGCGGRPCGTPAPRPVVVARPLARPPLPAPKAVAKAQPRQRPRLSPFNVAWSACTQCGATWTDEECVRLKEFLRVVGLREKVAHASAVVVSNRGQPLRWRLRLDYGYGSNPQGGARPPYVVKKSAMRAYYNLVARTR